MLIRGCVVQYNYSVWHEETGGVRGESTVGFELNEQSGGSAEQSGESVSCHPGNRICFMPSGRGGQ